MDAIYAVGKAATYQLQRGIRRDEDSRDIQREIDILNGFFKKRMLEAYQILVKTGLQVNHQKS